MPNREDLCSAALRHLSDAEGLLSTSPDQTWHLGGYGPECARKACLDDRWWDTVLGHDFGTTGDTALDVALSLDPAAARYELTGWSGRYPNLARWDVAHRYQRTGTTPVTAASELIDEAWSIVAPLVAELWADGVIQEIR